MSDVSKDVSQSLSDPSLETQVEELIQYALGNVHTAMPATVLMYNPESHSVDVQPSLKRVFRTSDGTIQTDSCPALLEVPICHPRSGGFAMTMPCSAGDTVLLVFSERSIDDWMTAGGEVVPVPFRKHDFSDAFAIPGVYPLSRTIPGLGLTDMVLGADGVEARLNKLEKLMTLIADRLELGGAGGPAVGRVGDSVQIDISTASAFYTWITLVSGNTIPKTPPFQGTIPGEITSGSGTVFAKD